MDTRLSPSTAWTPPPPSRGGTPPESDDLWESVLAGLREAVVVCDADGVVRRANASARELLPDLVVGELVDVARCRELAEAVHAGVPELSVELPGERSDEHDQRSDADGVATRRVRAWSRPLAHDAVCWYLLDVTEEHRRADSLLAEQDRARFLADAGRALHGVLHLERTLRTVVSLAVPRLARTALVLANPGDDEVRWAAADTTDTAHTTRPVAGRLALHDLRTAPHVRDVLVGDVGVSASDPWTAVEAADLDVWPRSSELSGAPGAGSRLLAVPVPTTGVARAVLVLGGECGGEELGAPRWAHPEAELVTEYASRVGAALASVALYREQVHLGSVLQESLAPPPLPPGSAALFGAAYRPARESLRVGGDFYEVVPPTAADENTTAFLLGDVCGKGIEAAVLSGRVRQSLHALRLLERRPRTLLELLNTALLDAAAVHGETPRFATMVLGDATPRADGSLLLRLATGGHPPPLVVRADGRVDTVDVVGTLVGALRDAVFGEAEVVLEPGDTCLIYSDGVTEARGPAGFFGEERLADVVTECGGAPPPVACERIVQLLSEWLDGRDHDDIAVLAVQAPGRPVAPAPAATTDGTAA